MVSATRSRTSGLRLGLGLALTLAAATAASPAVSEPQVADGTLAFQVNLRQSGPFTMPCPIGVPPEETACIPWSGAGFVRGLGKFSVTYDSLFEVGPPGCPPDFARSLATSARLRVAGEGTIIVAFAEGARCVPDPDWWHEPQEFTITGGTGRFAAASGRGTRERFTVPFAPADETWVGVLEVPRVAFDVSPPKLLGADSKTVRARRGAKRARVTFKVTATDRIDGVVPVSCRPRSGSRFEVGRTTVRCKATDSSGNTGRAAFPVIVKRRR